MKRRRGHGEDRFGNGPTDVGKSASISVAARTASADEKRVCGDTGGRGAVTEAARRPAGRRAAADDEHADRGDVPRGVVRDEQRTAWRPSTRRGYRGAIDGFLVPAFGTLRLEQLTPQPMQRWLTQHKTEHGARRRITLAHATLRSALGDAQRLQLVTINAGDAGEGAASRRRGRSRRSTSTRRARSCRGRGHRLGALFTVALACGLRLGEATGPAMGRRRSRRPARFASASSFSASASDSSCRS